MDISEPVTVSIITDSVINPWVNVFKAVINLNSIREGRLLELLDFQDHWLENFLTEAKLELCDLEQLGTEV